MEKANGNQSIQVITRAANIMRALGKNTDGMSLGQIAAMVELPRSTVQRIVSALSVEGFVTSKSGGGGIRLGSEIHNLAEASRTKMAERLRPMMLAISEATGETVDLAVLEGDKIMFIDQVVGSHRLRPVSVIGETFPLTNTANGKAALACLDEVIMEKLVLQEWQKDGKKSNALPEFLSEIAGVRNGRLALDDGDHTNDISALGLALKDDYGRIFSLSVPVPSQRFQRIRVKLETELKKWKRNLIKIEASG